MFAFTWSDRKSWTDSRRDEIPPSPYDDSHVQTMGLLYWEEHCVECAVPDCYTHCRLYVPREDGRCKRFTFGIYPAPDTRDRHAPLAEIQFERWGKLESVFPVNPRLVSINEIKRLFRAIEFGDRLVLACGRFLARIDRRMMLVRGYHHFLGRWLRKMGACATGRGSYAVLADIFSLEDETTNFQLEIVGQEVYYRRAIPLAPGWNRTLCTGICLEATGDPLTKIRFWPEHAQRARIAIQYLDIVPDEVVVKQSPAAQIKCVAWDLDETLWDGIIGDVGPHGVAVRKQMLDCIEWLDERGVLQTIVSKNEYDTAWEKITELGLAEYFLYPAINWGPKSESLRRIARELNIDLDTFAVIDDSAHERAEIASVLPQVRTFHPEAVTTGALQSLDAFPQVVTAISKLRRRSYRSEMQRKECRMHFSGTNDEFLATLHMTMRIFTPTSEELARCYELVQRSNQFNMSGRRYTEEEFTTFCTSAGVRPWAFAVSDRFGESGIVGFAAVEMTGDQPHLTEFVMSCRVAMKRVDETFLRWLARLLQSEGWRVLRATLTCTARNKPLRDVFATLPFRTHNIQDPVISLEMSLQGEITVPSIVEIDTT